MMLQKITPCIWFNDQAKEAVDLYISLFVNSKINGAEKYTKETAEASEMPEDSTMLIDFTIFGQNFIALNGGPAFKLTPAVSFVVSCDSKQELDNLWEKSWC